MRTKPPKKPQRAKCPACHQRRLVIQYGRIASEDYTLLENGIDGEPDGEDYGERYTGAVFCADCGWDSEDDGDDAEAYIAKLFNKATKKVNNA